MKNRYRAGVDIGGTKTAVLLSCEPPEVLSRIEFPTLASQGAEQAIEKIRKSLRQLLSAPGIGAQDLVAIGVSCGSPLDRINGVIQSPPNLSTWVDVPITSILSDEFGVPAGLENDANAGALAEHRFGAGRGTQHMVFLTMGTGLGAGIIANGQLYHGASDLAGEVGHVRLTRTGPVGHNKAGSAEGWASGAGMAEYARTAVAAAERDGRFTTLREFSRDKMALTAHDVARAAQGGDALAKSIIETVGEKLGSVMAILIDILNPEVIVVGGLAMRLGEAILEPARRMVQLESLAPAVSACRIVPAVLDERIGDLAALCVAMNVEVKEEDVFPEPAGSHRGL
jgi:glucokinase